MVFDLSIQGLIDSEFTVVKVYKKNLVIDTLVATPGKVWTTGALADTVDWSMSSTGGALNRLLKEFPENLKTPTRGVWVWNENKEIEKHVETPVANSKNSITVEVITRQNGSVLVKDSKTNTLYTLKEFKL